MQIQYTYTDTPIFVGVSTYMYITKICRYIQVHIYRKNWLAFCMKNPIMQIFSISAGINLYNYTIVYNFRGCRIQHKTYNNYSAAISSYFNAYKVNAEINYY